MLGTFKAFFWCQNILTTLLHEWPKSQLSLKALYPMSKIDINFVFQVSKRVSCGPVSIVFATQVSTASTLYLFSLAFSKPETSTTSSKTKGWDFQLQCWCLLFQIRRNHGHLPRRRRVSPIFYLFWSRSKVLRGSTRNFLKVLNRYFATYWLI